MGVLILTCKLCIYVTPSGGIVIAVVVLYLFIQCHEQVKILISDQFMDNYLQTALLSPPGKLGKLSCGQQVSGSSLGFYQTHTNICAFPL